MPRLVLGAREGAYSAAHMWIRWGQSSSVIVLLRHGVLHLILMLMLLLLCCLALGLGGSSLGYEEVFSLVAGTATPGTQLIVLQWRMPRILLAVVVGAALGVSGYIFQTITRNPLGSPDLMGFTMGAQTGILTSLILFQASFALVTISALIGGLVCASLVFFLAFRGGFGGLRLILAGIAVSSMLGSFNRWLLIHADSDTAYGAVQAITGSLANTGWEITVPTTLITLVLLALTLCLNGALRNYHLGQDLLISLGANLRYHQPLLLGVGVALVAITTVAAGPLAFVALLAPHLARLLYRASMAPAYASALVGALLLLSADIASQTLFDSLPVGIVTAAVGGVYFMSLLLVEMRKKNA